jgi:prenyltransferase beta subunit
MALARAKAKGFAVDDDALIREREATMATLRPGRERFLVGGGVPDLLDAAYLLTGVGASGYEPDGTTEALARYLFLRQTQRGGFRIMMQRPPSDASDIALTALAVRALSLYGASIGPAISARIDRARTFLGEAEPRCNEDLVFKALGLRWAGASARDVEGTIATLVASQNADGGFAQLPGLESDAYATGQAIVALREAAGRRADDPVVVQGIRFLLARQLADGSWFVATRSPAAQPYFESGFPHGRSQFISVAATAWATMALADAREP